MNYGSPLVACLILTSAASAATLRETMASQQVTIQKLEQLVEKQGALLDKLQQKLEEKPAPAPSPAPSPEPVAAGAPSEPGSPSASDRLSMEAMKQAGNIMAMQYVDNLVGESVDKTHRIFIGGRLQLDGAFAHATDALELGPGNIGLVQDAVNIRRSRFDLGGTLFTDMDFYLQFEFLNQFNAERAGAPILAATPQPTDAWMQFKNLPVVGTLRVGNQKEALSFEHLISSRFLDLMERSSCFDAFIEDQSNGFKMGLNLFNWTRDERMTWAVGLFKNTRNGFGSNLGDGEWGVTARLAGTPVYEDEGRRLVHVALAGSRRDLDDGETRFRTRLLVRNGNNVQHNIVGDVRLAGTSESRVVPELTVVNGPFCFQSEYFAAQVDDAVFPNAAGRFVGDVHFNGYYAMVSYFLTGEHKNYNRKIGSFSRVIPKRNANWGPDAAPGDPLGGAWMLAYRRGGVDLNDASVTGGELTDDTLGLNWFLNRDVKLQWNYTKTERDAVVTADGTIHSYGTRLAFDF